MATAATEDKMTALGIERIDRPPEEPSLSRTGTGLFRSAGEPALDMGSDGDDIGRSAKDQAVSDMLDSGHGFLVRRIESTHKPRRISCEICDGPLPTPGADPDWLCQYYDETRPASVSCNCAWCLAYQGYLAGKYKPQGGRPRQRCGAAACEREADKLRKRRKRAGLPPQGEAVQFDEPPVTDGRPEGKPRAVPDPSRGQQDDNPPRTWNRPRRRNEPNWWLSGQVKRGLVRL